MRISPVYFLLFAIFLIISLFFSDLRPGVTQERIPRSNQINQGFLGEISAWSSSQSKSEVQSHQSRIFSRLFPVSPHHSLLQSPGHDYRCSRTVFWCIFQLCGFRHGALQDMLEPHPEFKGTPSRLNVRPTRCRQTHEQGLSPKHFAPCR